MNNLVRAARNILLAVGELPPNKKLIRAAFALQKVLSEQAEQEPVVKYPGCDYCNDELFCGRKCKCCGKVFIEDEDFVQSEVKSLRQQVAALKAVVDAWNNVEQKPVAYVYEKDVAGIGMRKDVAFLKNVEVGTDLYTAPVPITTPDVCGEVCARAKLCYGCGKALDEANAEHERKYGELAGTHNWTPPNYTDEQWQKLDQEYQDHVAEQKPVAYVYEKHIDGFGTRKDVAFLKRVDAGTKLYAAPQPVMQEPVAWMRLNEKGECENIEYIGNFDEHLYLPPSCQWLYAAPVRTKDLTNEELNAMWYGNTKGGWIGLLRAVIAADREKNNV